MPGPRDVLKPWVLEAIAANGGRAKPLDVAKHIWKNHERDLSDMGDMFFRWQYDMGWAAHVLRKERKLKQAGSKADRYWELAEQRKAA